MRPALATLVLVLWSCSPTPLVMPPKSQEKPHRHYARFEGEARHGQDFEREFGNGLLFRLDADRDPVTPGWIIEIRPKGGADPEVELAWVATPPFRFFNARYLNVSYGNTAKQSVDMNLRKFRFLVSPEDYAEEAAAVRQMLWPADEAEFDAALKRAGRAPRCEGTFRILDHRIGTPPEGGTERIEWLKFEVELCATPKER